MRGATSSGFRLAWIAVFVILTVLMISVPSVADAQTPFDHQYGSSVVSPEIGEKGKEVAAAFTGVLPETGGVPFLVLGALLMSAGTGLFALRRLGRRTGRRGR
ncbi:LPXTG cell wall anchor domain-containing protein [Rubrobacter tropicus]|uniref:LPXTG cell wall anchor domain-containing protein n=1 Tax=Rubrobacter tropicus TaxID=2653851 RepID=A0A6G8Q9J9_9ACTN|nr:LPXTG cell wall anchor domain-containing protein [Rubrobacter tropicus]QIN83164.1 LPXTG cell wall anchor domain-containing protein [Rubrobacter tropicus]